MPQIDPELSKILTFFCYSRCNFCTVSERFRSRFQHNQLNGKRTSYAIHFLNRALQRFASKTLQNDSKGDEKFQNLQFCAICVLFESFWNQKDGKRSTETELIFQ